MRNIDHILPKYLKEFRDKHNLKLGQLPNGLFYVPGNDNDPKLFDRHIAEVSNWPTGKSAICMMQRYLKRRNRK